MVFCVTLYKKKQQLIGGTKAALEFQKTADVGGGQTGLSVCTQLFPLFFGHFFNHTRFQTTCPLGALFYKLCYTVDKEIGHLLFYVFFFVFLSE